MTNNLAPHLSNILIVHANYSADEFAGSRWVTARRHLIEDVTGHPPALRRLRKKVEAGYPAVATARVATVPAGVVYPKPGNFAREPRVVLSDPPTAPGAHDRERNVTMDPDSYTPTVAELALRPLSHLSRLEAELQSDMASAERQLGELSRHPSPLREHLGAPQARARHEGTVARARRGLADIATARALKAAQRAGDAA